MSADLEERVRDIERTAAVRDSEMGTMKEIITDMTAHLGSLNSSVDKLTKYIIVIFIVSMLTDNHDPLVRLLGL